MVFFGLMPLIFYFNSVIMFFREGHMTLWFASGNTHKKKELADILSAEIFASVGGLELKIPKELKIPSDAGLSFEPEETGNSFLENAMIKAEALYRLLEKQSPGRSFHPVIADDSGIWMPWEEGRGFIRRGTECQTMGKK
jgi:XTP/dITP diphosphohydrolase